MAMWQCGGLCCRHPSHHMRAVNERHRANLVHQTNQHLHPRNPPLNSLAHPYVPTWQTALCYQQPRQQQVYTAAQIARSNHYSMAMQHATGGNTSQQSPPTFGRDDDIHQTPVFASQPQLIQSRPGYIFQGQSFFEDCTDYRPEEAALYNPTHGYPIKNRDSRIVELPVSPYQRASFPLTSTPSLVGHVGADEATATIDDMALTRLVQTNVDTKMFQPVEREDWRKASLDFGYEDDEFATSPTSTIDTGYGPVTPVDSKLPDDDWQRSFSQDMSSSFGASAEGLDMFDKPGHGLSFSSTSDIEAGIGDIGSQFAGLPFQESLRAPSMAELPLVAGPFRDTRGYPPAFAAIAPATEDHDSDSGSCTGRAVAKTKRRRALENRKVVISRDQKDQFLLDKREEGFTYKEIKQMGGFAEAESTMRGRVRVLTKDRSERVRKPVWTDNDVHLLRRGVARANKLRAEGTYNRSRHNKLPWKFIAEYIEEHGGSYSFAAATCAKKWDDIR